MNAPSRLATNPEKLRLTVEDFLLLNDSGAFADYSKTELIDGEIWYMAAQHSRHARIKTNLGVELAIKMRELRSPLRPIIEASTRVSALSLPEPDIVVSDYKGPHVVPLETVALIVEVSDSTLDVDLGRKLRLYARAGIAEYWVVDVEGRQVLCMWAPEGERYLGDGAVAFGERLASRTVAGLEVASDGLE